MPSVNLRFVTGAQRTIDVPDDATVSSIKDVVADEYMRDTLRVCLKGEVLDDSITIASLNLADTDRLIITGRRNNPSAPPPQAAQAPTAPLAQATKAPTPALPVGGVAVDQEALRTLEAMGFTDQAASTQALRAAYNNVDRAVEYLCTGIPPNVLRQMNNDSGPVASNTQVPRPQPSAPSPSGLTPQSLFATPGNAQSDLLRERLTALPQYPQMVQLVRENPSTIPEILNQLHIHHEDIYNLAVANPTQFTSLLGVDTQSGASPQVQQRAFRARSAEDEEPIQRLVALGGGAWDDRSAALAYIVTDRNEETAANILIDNNGLPEQLRPALEQFRDQLAPP